jgi:hypothetical protein
MPLYPSASLEGAGTMVTFKIQPSINFHGRSQIDRSPLDETSFTLESDTAPDANEWTWDSISLDTTMITENGGRHAPFAARPHEMGFRYVFFILLSRFFQSNESSSHRIHDHADTEYLPLEKYAIFRRISLSVFPCMPRDAVRSQTE